MSVELEVTVDLNEFHKLARKDVAALLGAAGVKGAVIFNASHSAVTFYTYNYSDGIHWIPAQQTLVANNYYGTVAASGQFFKIHPNNNSAEEFLVEPGNAYVYKGPGMLEKAN